MKKVRSSQAAIMVVIWVKHRFSLWVLLKTWKLQMSASSTSRCQTRWQHIKQIQTQQDRRWSNLRSLFEVGHTWSRKIQLRRFNSLDANFEHVPYYRNIKCCINQRELGSSKVSLSRTNECSVYIFLALICTLMEKWQ